VCGFGRFAPDPRVVHSPFALAFGTPPPADELASMTNHAQIELLVIDDDDEFRSLMVRRFTQAGFRVQEAANAEQALALAERRDVDVVVCDMVMPGLSGIELLEQFKQEHPECEVLLLTGQGTVETAVKAMKLGAYDFLTKPFPLRDLEPLIEKAYERRRLHKENRQLKALLERVEPQLEMVGESPLMQELFRLIERAGPSDKAILIQGESGTGKELVARGLHRCSRRIQQPMVVINCAALPEALLESELFGHEKGAFTGAVSAKPGLFEVADGGTLFIDEIGELPGSLQAKLLRVLEDGSLRRIGSIKERRVNVRLLAATNRNMSDEVKQGRFREDLYYRINVMSLELPTLRQRRSDIPLLVAHFLGGDWDIEESAMRALEQYDWPGNVRQLINALDRAKILSDDHIVHLHDLPHEVTDQVPENNTPSALQNPDRLAALERSKILEVLQREGGNKSRTARVLGIDRRKLYRLVEKYGIEV
jgi:DNA-binding NtrC family response regulator